MNNDNYVNIEAKFRKKLLSIYPQENVLFEYRMGMLRYADAILVNDSGIPIAIFELKATQQPIHNSNSAIRAGKEFLIKFKKNSSIPSFLVVVSADNNGNINHYYVYRLHLETEELEQISWPDLEILQAGIKAKTIINEKTKQKKNLNVIAIKSWVIILMGIALLVLDSELLLKFLPISYKITSERMGFMLFLVILFYIPNISEISIANFSLKLINSKEEEEKNLGKSE